MSERMTKPMTIKGTVSAVLVKYPHGVQAQESSTAALTAVSIEEGGSDPNVRQATFTAVLSGDLRSEFAEGDAVDVTLKNTGTVREAPPPKLDGIAPAREQAGYGVAAVVLVPKDAEAPSNPKPAESAKEPAKKSY